MPRKAATSEDRNDAWETRLMRICPSLYNALSNLSGALQRRFLEFVSGRSSLPRESRSGKSFSQKKLEG